MCGNLKKSTAPLSRLRAFNGGALMFTGMLSAIIVPPALFLIRLLIP